MAQALRLKHRRLAGHRSETSYVTKSIKSELCQKSIVGSTTKVEKFILFTDFISKTICQSYSCGLCKIFYAGFRFCCKSAYSLQYYIYLEVLSE